MFLRQIAAVNIAGAVIGSALELYEYVIYAICSVYFAPLFFPSAHAATSYIMSLGAFFAGFISRPLGAVIFGIYGDRKGRRNTLAVALLLTAIPTLVIGVMPGFATIGLAAPLIVVLARIIQGIGFGGEFAGASVFMSEHAPRSRYLPAALVFAAAILASAVAMALVAGLEINLGEKQMSAWAWRIPFILGTVLIGIGVMVRRRGTETPVFVQLREHQDVVANSLLGVLRDHKRLCVTACAVLCVATQAYLLFIFMPSMAKNYYALSLPVSTLFSILATLVTVCFVLLSARAAERVGGRPLMIGANMLLVVVAWPLFALVNLHPLYLLLAQVVMAMLLGVVQGPMMGLLITMFPPAVRYSGLSLAYNISYALFGGISPLLAATLLGYFPHSGAPGLLLIGCALISLAGLLASSRFAGSGSATAPVAT